MFELGDSEILILLFLALLVLGPEEIPPLARRLGSLVRGVRGAWSRLRAEIDRETGLEEWRNILPDERRSTTPRSDAENGEDLR